LTTGHPLFPGILASGVLAAAAAFLAQHYGAPVMLLALLLGMAMNFLSDEGGCVPGIEFTARTLLRLGVALLGLCRAGVLSWRHSVPRRGCASWPVSDSNLVALMVGETVFLALLVLLLLHYRF
jgi:hypothetical protein